MNKKDKSFDCADDHRSAQDRQDNIERRTFHIELRQEERDKPPQIEGYAAVFDSLSEEMWGMREIIEPGFFDDVLEDDTRALFNHDRNYVLGRASAGTLKLRQDSHGLQVEIDPPQTDLVRDLVLEPMRRGDIDKMSFAFTVKPGGDDWQEEDGQLIRVLKKGGALRLYDVSVVTEPAYPDTSAQVRTKINEFQQKETAQAASGGAEVQARAAARRRRLHIAAHKYPNE